MGAAPPLPPLQARLPADQDDLPDVFALYQSYDPIGSRRISKINTTETACTRNELNQYDSTTNPSESFQYDGNVDQHNDGNLTRDGKYNYTYDAENRLTTVMPRNPVVGDKKLVFRHDYLGRCVQKLVYRYNWRALTPVADRSAKGGSSTEAAGM